MKRFSIKLVGEKYRKDRTAKVSGIRGRAYF